LSAGDAFAYDMFGISVSISGDVAIVGAFGDDDGGSYSGSAYILERQGNIWVQQAKLKADDARAEDHFAYSVSIDGDYAIVGAADDDDSGSSSGSAYIFWRDGAGWVQQAKLTAADGAADDYFGRSVSISGDYAIVAAYYDDDDGLNSGSAYIFRRDGMSWIQQAKITAADAAAEDHFGSSVSIAGDYAIVGTEDVDDIGNSSGAAYIFKRNGADWIQQVKLTASDAKSYQYFGDAVSISGDYAIVGALGDDDGGNRAGAAYIFKRAGSNWIQQAKITAEDAAESDMLGRPVSISGDVAIIGATGDDDGGSSSGSAYVFRRDGSNWVQKAKLTAADAAADDLFGASVSISGGYAVVGAPYKDSYSGSAYFYELPVPTVALAADPEVIAVGDAATLAWSSNNAFACDIEPGVGEVSAEGTTVVSPAQTTTYTITAIGPQGTATDQLTVNVYDPGAPITVSAAAEPSDLQPGQSSTLTWSATNAVSCIIEPGIGPVDLSGSISVSPIETTTYTITAANPAGATTATVTVTVNYPPPTATISAQPGTIYSGESSTLTWSSTDAVSCVIEPGIGSVDLNGSISVSPTETTTYTITAANPGGTVNDSATVTVITPLISGAKLIAGDGQSDDLFGYSVSISGDYAIAGAVNGGDEVDNSGAAYILKREGSNWNEETEITADDAASGDEFGFSVCIDGDYAIVGAPYDDDGASDSGSAYIFKREGSSWIQQAKLTAADAAASDSFGYAVSISGDYAIVGANRDDVGMSNTGSAYIFKREDSSWIQQAKLTADDALAFDEFGISVSISGEYAIVGAILADGTDEGGTGAAYIFKLDGSGWTQQAKLAASDAAVYDYFGISVSISGDHAIVGAYLKNGAEYYSGAAYVFGRDGSSWNQQTKLTASDVALFDLFGYFVSISGDHAFVGAPGKMIAGYYSGAAYLFKRESSGWVQLEKLTADEPAAAAYFGYGVSISGHHAIVGAYGDSDNGSSSGAVYLYSFSQPAVAISADATVVQTGEPVTLTWSSQKTDARWIEPDIGAVDVDGSIVVSPAETTTYTITATSAEGTHTESVTVYVYDPAAPITVSATADPANIQPGQSSTLTWSTTNAVSCVIEPGIGPVDLSGSITVTPTETTTYTMTAANPSGETTAAVTVTVNYPPPTATISAQPGAIVFGETSVLTWSSTNAVSCVIEPDIGPVDLNGSTTVSPTETTIYTISAANPEGTTTETVTVTVYLPPSIQELKLTAGDSVAYDSFGYSVGIDGDFAIVGAYGDDDGGSYSGSAYIFKQEGSGGWSQQAKLTAGDPAQDDSFGYSVAISGDYAIVGAFLDSDDGSYSGSAYIFKREGTSWYQQAKLTAADATANDFFGYSVSISGDYAIVGAENNDDDVSGSGAAYIFKREGSSWFQQAKITAEEPVLYEGFGHSVSISGDFAIVGVSGGQDKWRAYIYQRNGSNWIQQANITAAGPAQYDEFGAAVGISGDYAIVGANSDNDGGIHSGAAYIFKHDGSSWYQQAKIKAADQEQYDYFGYSVSISGDYAIVGAYRDDDGGSSSGSVYVFRRDGSNWMQQDKLTAADAAADDDYGLSVSISGGYALVGAPGNDDHGSHSGSVYFYDIPVPTVTMSGDPSAIQAGDSTTLSWSSTNAYSCVIEPGIGNVAVEGSIVIMPTETTTYTITATGIWGTVTDRVTVNIYDPAFSVAVSISTAPANIEVGDSAVLTWNSTNAATCVIEPGIGPVDLNGSLTVSPAETTTYTITAAHPGSSVSATVTVTVDYPPPTVNLSVDSGTIVLGESAILRWNSTAAASAVIEPGVGSVDVNGSVLISPLETTTYTITVTGAGGMATDNVTVTVVILPPEVSFSAEPDHIDSGQTSLLTWTATQADTVVIDQGIGSVANTGSLEVSPTETTTYTLTASGPGGTHTESVTVTVNRRPGIYYEYDPMGRVIKITRVPQK
jgi:hypothetical protein